MVAVSGHGSSSFLACLDERSAGYTTLSARHHCIPSHACRVPGTETFLPSTVSSTSAWRCAVVAKVRAVREPLRAASAGVRGIERNRWDRIVLRWPHCRARREGRESGVWPWCVDDGVQKSITYMRRELSVSVESSFLPLVRLGPSLPYNLEFCAHQS